MMAKVLLKAAVVCGFAIVTAGFLFAGTKETKDISVPSEPCSIATYFSPYDNVEEVVHKILSGAKKSVHCSLYGITNERLASDLETLKAKGLDVEVGLDKKQASRKER